MQDQPPPYATIVFDCDSTLSSIEGICELAGEQHAEELDRLTAGAMDGTTPLEEVYGQRLELVQPTRADVDRVGQRYIDTALPFAREVVQALRSLGKRVVVVSGGLLPPVRTLAAHLGIELDQVHAVDIHFDERGEYAGFEKDSPLARAGGKPELMRALANENGAEPICLIGDGATDLEAASDIARFVAFGGVERREKVFAAARVHCEVADFRALLPLLLSSTELETLQSRPDQAHLLT